MGLSALAAESFRNSHSSGEWEITYNLGLLHHSQGNLERAAALYREVLSNQEEFAEARLNLGNVLFAMGNIEEGKECWKIAIQKRPDLTSNFLASAN
jgi:tetratricopeptide (TPR) repeat protein